MFQKESMTNPIPSHYERIYSAADIARRVHELGAEIAAWSEDVWTRTGKDVLAVPVLRGAIFFFADLVREVPRSVEIAPVRTWGYDPSANVAQGSLRINLDEVDAHGRSILLVDDICDSGRSLDGVKKAFLDAGAAEVRSVVLVRRMIEKPQHLPDWSGFEFAKDSWFVGYGMDDCERWRNLGDIYVMKQG